MNRWNRFKNWVRNLIAPTFKFKSYLGNFSVATPVAPSVRVRPKWLKEQKGEARFAHCPGMMDYMNAGYIITAHSDIHIRANSEGVVVMVEGMPVAPEHHHRLSPAPFNYELVEGMVNPIDVAKEAWKIPLPWSIQSKRKFSAYVMPALMHADYHDKIWVMPGITHSDKFHTVNFVFVPLKECDFIIPAGTPLLQILPLRRETITANCGKANERELDEHLFNMPSRLKGYYRKYLSSKNSFKMSCPYDHRG